MSNAEDGCCTVMFKPWSVDSYGIHRNFWRGLQKEIKKNKFTASQLTCSHIFRDVQWEQGWEYPTVRKNWGLGMGPFLCAQVPWQISHSLTCTICALCIAASHLSVFSPQGFLLQACQYGFTVTQSSGSVLGMLIHWTEVAWGHRAIWNLPVPYFWGWSRTSVAPRHEFPWDTSCS